MSNLCLKFGKFKADNKTPKKVKKTVGKVPHYGEEKKIGQQIEFSFANFGYIIK